MENKENQALPMELEVKIYAMREDGSTLANASVCLNGCFAVRGIRVVNGSKGVFAAMPTYRSGDGYKEVCYPCTKEFHKQLSQAVLDAYWQALEQSAHQEQKTSEPSMAPEMRM